MRRFDALVHITADGRWLGTSRHDASLNRLVAEMDAAEVERACLVGIAGYADNETLEAAARLYPRRFVPIAGFNPAEFAAIGDIEARVGELARRGFAGIKLHPRLNDYDPLDPRCLAAIDAAGRHGLPAMICTLFRRPTAATRHPSDVVDRIATSCRNTRVVLLHGGGSAIRDLFELVRMHEHLLLDVSFSIMRYAGSSIDLDLRFAFDQLDQRTVVGSDFPEYAPRSVYDRVNELTMGLSTTQRENILFRNLTRLFQPWIGYQS
ncbi:MAG TPA: amidohydrolase family protein [Pirellulales bacterium]|nr:amidohydrolase family protein [Pirellulales bacterium]